MVIRGCGKGMAVKPRDVAATTQRGISQPGIKTNRRQYGIYVMPR